jgi:hypothetical protein
VKLAMRCSQIKLQAKCFLRKFGQLKNCKHVNPVLK